MQDNIQIAIASLQKQRLAVQEQLARIDTALAALSEGTRNLKSTRTCKPCCNKSEVIAILADLLRDNDSLSKSELEDLVKDKLSSQLGKSLSGFALRFKEAIADSKFTEHTPGHYRLALDL